MLMPGRDRFLLSLWPRSLPGLPVGRFQTALMPCVLLSLPHAHLRRAGWHRAEEPAREPTLLRARPCRLPGAEGEAGGQHAVKSLQGATGWVAARRAATGSQRRQGLSAKRGTQVGCRVWEGLRLSFHVHAWSSVCSTVSRWCPWRHSAWSSWSPGSAVSAVTEPSAPAGVEWGGG